MSEPITLYPTAKGDPITVYSPQYAAGLVAEGLYSYEPLPPPQKAEDTTKADAPKTGTPRKGK